MAAGIGNEVTVHSPSLFVGTSGYSYVEWRGTFYPEKLSRAAMLSHYARHFNTVEINSTFYRMPTEKMIADWVMQVPDGFSFVLKTSRRITHQKRLKGVADEVSYLVHAMSLLGDKLGPVLVQLPPNMRRDSERLSDFLDGLPGGWRVALEFRNSSWFDEESYQVLREHNAALVSTDGGKGDPPMALTADWGYVRLRKAQYTDAELSQWCDLVRQERWTDAFVFFKHEDEGAGPALATRFGKLFATRWN